jgi:hypothetical protein
VTDGDGIAAPGVTFSSVADFYGKTPATGRVIEVEAPSRFVYECEDSGGRYRWTMELTSMDGGTYLTQTFQRISAPLWIRSIQAPLLYPCSGSACIAMA